jgi:hypothetical protein
LQVSALVAGAAGGAPVSVRPGGCRSLEPAARVCGGDSIVVSGVGVPTVPLELAGLAEPGLLAAPGLAAPAADVLPAEGMAPAGVLFGVLAPVALLASMAPPELQAAAAANTEQRAELRRRP